jgi:hypothetical protein
LIIKKKDSLDPQFNALRALQALNLNPRQQKAVESELRMMKAGAHGEQQSSYFIDYYFETASDWAVLHDVRFEHEGRVAQIDHLVINRLLEIYVLESKSFHYGLDISANGEFLVRTSNYSKAIESPIEQNKRHIFFLEQFFKVVTGILPKRFGMLTRQPSFHGYVLVSPKSRVMRPTPTRFDTSSVIKSDALYSSLTENTDNSAGLLTKASKMISEAQLMTLAQKLAGFHKQAPVIDYKKKFGISNDCISAPPSTAPRVTAPQAAVQAPQPGPEARPDHQSQRQQTPPSRQQSRQPFTQQSAPQIQRHVEPESSVRSNPSAQPRSPTRPNPPARPAPQAASHGAVASQANSTVPRNNYFCAQCRCDISPKVAHFCFTQKARFGGRAYCMSCQKKFMPANVARG